MAVGTQIDSEIRSAGITVQLVRHDWPTPVDASFVEAECEHVVALQRQPIQLRSDGRFCDADGSFAKIGKVLAIPAGARLQVRASGGPVCAVRCAFAADRFQSFAMPTSFREEHVLSIAEPGIHHVLKRLGREAGNPGFASAILIESLGNAMIVDLIRYTQRSAAGSKTFVRGGLPHFKLQRLTERVEDECPAPTLLELAELAGLSPRHLRRAFKESTGMTIHKYVAESQYRKATALLKTSDLPLKEIAFRLGFSHQAAFTAAFRKIAGDTPRQFRGRMRVLGSRLK